MSAPTNTVTTLNTIGNREDLEDVIYRVAPEKTPFVSNIGKTSATATYHEWQTETLATPNAANAQYEGDDVTFAAGNQPTRIGGSCQIFRKEVVVSRTQESTKTAGRSSDTARQKALKLIELRRDMEARFIGNYAQVKTETPGTTARQSAGALAWLTTNTSKGSGGADGGFSSGNVTAATNGTQRTFTETLFKGVLAAVFQAGGDPTMAFAGPSTKQTMSTFTGIAQLRHETGEKRPSIIGGADVYMSDFGEISLVPHAYGLTRDCLIVDPTMWAVASLDGTSWNPLAKTGDAEKYAIFKEACLEAKNEKASGVVRDLL